MDRKGKGIVKKVPTKRSSSKTFLYFNACHGGTTAEVARSLHNAQRRYVQRGNTNAYKAILKNTNKLMPVPMNTHVMQFVDLGQIMPITFYGDELLNQIIDAVPASRMHDFFYNESYRQKIVDRCIEDNREYAEAHRSRVLPAGFHGRGMSEYDYYRYVYSHPHVFHGSSRVHPDIYFDYSPIPAYKLNEHNHLTHMSTNGTFLKKSERTSKKREGSIVHHAKPISYPCAVMEQISRELPDPEIILRTRNACSNRSVVVIPTMCPKTTEDVSSKVWRENPWRTMNTSNRILRHWTPAQPLRYTLGELIDSIRAKHRPDDEVYIIQRSCQSHGSGTNTNAIPQNIQRYYERLSKKTKNLTRTRPFMKPTPRAKLPARPKRKQARKITKPASSSRRTSARSDTNSSRSASASNINSTNNMNQSENIARNIIEGLKRLEIQDLKRKRTNRNTNNRAPKKRKT